MAPLETTTLQDIFNDDNAPSDNIGLCQKCIQNYQSHDKEYCQICFKLYCELQKPDILTTQHPLSGSTTMVDVLSATDAACNAHESMVYYIMQYCKTVSFFALVFLSPPH